MRCMANPELDLSNILFDSKCDAACFRIARQVGKGWHEKSTHPPPVHGISKPPNVDHPHQHANDCYHLHTSTYSKKSVDI